MGLCAYVFNDPHSDMLGTWDYTSCTDEQSVAICQHYAGSQSLPFLRYYDIVSRDYHFFFYILIIIFFPDKQEDPGVTEGEFQANNNTFKVVLKENVTWYDALELCKKNGMDLASVADAYQQAVLTVHVSRAREPLWIGLFSGNVKVSYSCIYTHTHKQTPS